MARQPSSRSEPDWDVALGDLRAFIERLPLAACVCDTPGGAIRFHNHAMAELWGRTPEAADLRDDGAYSGEMLVPRPDGSRVAVHVTSSPLHDLDGRLVAALNVFTPSAERSVGGTSKEEPEEGRYRAIVDELADLVCRFKPDGTITYANQAYRRYFALDPEGDVAEPFASRVHPDDLARVQSQIAALTPSVPVANIEHRVVRGDGVARWMQWTSHAVFDEHGRAVELQATGRDVTGQRRAEEDTGRLAAIVTGADDAIISKTLDGIITSWNRAAAEMFGHTQEEAIGRSITLIIPPDRLDEERDILARLRRGEAIEHFETERMTKDGRLISVSLSISPVRDSQGRIIGASKILRDMTERRTVEGRLQATVQTLETLYRLADAIGRARTRTEVCDAAVLAVQSVTRADRASVLAFDEGGVMRFVSWLGLSERYRSATEGHSPWKRDSRDPQPVLIEDVQEAAALGALREVVRREGIRSLGFFPLVHQGQLLGKFMLYYDAPHVFLPDELRLAATAAQHVSQGLARADSEREIERLLEREQSARHLAESARGAAVRANREKDEFLAMLAHELRNPVGVIVNAVSLIEGSPDQAQLPARAAAMIRRQAGHLSRLLDDLLDVARITSGRIQMEREAVDLGEVLNLAIESQRHQVEGKRQRLTVAPRAQGVVTRGDPVRLQQVFGNLLNNASKYSEPEGSIRISLEVEGGEAVLRVRDEGTGIPADKLDSIFELFAQADPGLARTQGGLGIGLTLVKRIVELHGGTVTARSEGLGRGAELTVRLPLAADAALAAREAPAPPKTTPRRVLVIEDNTDGRDALASTLARYGHEVLTASTGQEGIDTALQALPDVALVDIGLPDVDGYEVARTLRRQLAGRIQLVALTGYGQPEDRAQARQAGFDTHLVKPIEPDRLAQVIESLRP